MHLHHNCADAHRSQKMESDPVELELEGCELLDLGARHQTQSLEEQQMLLSTEPFLQLP